MLRHLLSPSLASNAKYAASAVGSGALPSLAVLQSAQYTSWQRCNQWSPPPSPAQGFQIRWESKDAASAPHSGIQSDEKPSTEKGLPGSRDYNPAPHPSKLSSEKGSDYLLMHPVYEKEYLESITPKHRPPSGVRFHYLDMWRLPFMDTAAYWSIQAVRTAFDWVTGYGPNMTTDKWLTRVVFLETVAGVPGMVGAMIRHLHSLRLMRRDHGWIHTLLEEAENERMHLLTFLQLKQPGWFMRTMVLFTQGIFCNMFFISYLISPTYCHSMVGYLEEEAVRTYTHLLKDIDEGKLNEWANTPVPTIAIDYWRLNADASMRDLVLAVRADEACHSHVNHTFAGMKADDTNPFSPGAHQVP